MGGQDPHRISHELDEETSERIIKRLESRAHDEVFIRLFHQYVEKLAFPESASVLEAGCGTGVITRALARKQHFSGDIVGIDQSPAFIEAARRFADQEKVDECAKFRVCDAHRLDFEDKTFDIAIAHTLISHVTEPVSVIRELSRVLRDDGTLVIFDGDYTSLTYAVADPEFGRMMDHALSIAAFNNPGIMRELIRILPEQGFEITETMADVVSEIGGTSYFISFAETYAPFVPATGLMIQQDVDGWLMMLHRMMENNMFFASCNYYTYIVRKNV